MALAMWWRRVLVQVIRSRTRLISISIWLRLSCPRSNGHATPLLQGGQRRSRAYSHASFTISRSTSPPGRTEKIGSILTCLFHHFQIDLTPYTCIDRIERMDTAYLIHCDILRDETTYHFCDEQRILRFCKLLQLPLTHLDTEEDLRFLPSAEFLCPYPCDRTLTRSRARSSRLLQPPTDEDVMTEMPTSLPSRRTTYHSEFDLPDISDNTNTVEYQRWMITAQRRNNSLMQGILSTISRGCYHTTETRATGQVSHDADTPGPSTRLPRCRRQAGWDGSESPDTASNA